jgi:flagellar basal body-associated protein FliL
MKNEPSDKTEAEGSEATATPTTGRSGFSVRAWAIAALVLWTVANAAAFAFFRGQTHLPEEVPSPEIALGEFKFRADPADSGPLATARFSLHIAFAPPSDRAGRERLAERKFRVQQDVEELLRRAHGADFDDPSLRGLKRQIQEQINETLGLRAVADVIITNLTLEPVSRPASNDTPHTAHPAKKPRG